MTRSIFSRIDARWQWITAVAAADAVLLNVSNFEMVWRVELLALLAFVLLCVGISLIYTYLRPDPKLAGALQSAALFCLLTNLLAVFSYLLVGLSTAPLIDAQLAAFDGAIGFHWLAWKTWIFTPPALGTFVGWCYNSLGVEFILLIILLDPMGRTDRARELFFGVAAVSVIELVVGYWFPAAGAFVQYATPEAHTTSYVQQFMALRDGSLRNIDIFHTNGVLQFPSFHTGLAVICSFVVRGMPRFAWPLWTVNFLVIVSTPSCGGHYLADVLMGLLITIPTMIWIGSRTRHARNSIRG
jgi:hypothetical protein